MLGIPNNLFTRLEDEIYMKLVFKETLNKETYMYKETLFKETSCKEDN